MAVGVGPHGIEKNAASRPFPRIPPRGGAGRDRLRAYDGPRRRPQVGPGGGRGHAASLDNVPIDGTIVIGEGERDEAPMLYIGEKVGLAAKRGGAREFPKVDIAVDPLEGTNLCATGAPNALAVLAASDRGGLLHAPDLYMEKLVVGPSVKDAVSLDAPVTDNLRAIARCLERDVEDLVVDRPRSSATREAHRADPRGRRAHPTHHRRRPLGGYRRGCRRKRRARGHGHGRRAGRRAHRRGDALPERRDLRPTRRQDSRARGALPGDGHHGRAQDLHVAGARLRLIDHICRDRCHRRHADEGACASSATASAPHRSSCRAIHSASGSSTRFTSSNRKWSEYRF